MAGNEVRLLTGELRKDYISKRLREGAAVPVIVAEINHPTRYSGPEGGEWPSSSVYGHRTRMIASGKLAAPTTPDPDEEDLPISDEGDEDDDEDELQTRSSTVVPAAFQGILDEEDVAAVRAEARKKVAAAARKKARAQLLAQMEQELEREHRQAMRDGRMKFGDVVTVTIDLAEYSPGIMLDGEWFQH